MRETSAISEAIMAAVKAAACRDAALVDAEQASLWIGAAEFQSERASQALARMLAEHAQA